MTPVVWRSLRTGFRCSAEPNWPSIPRQFRRCRQTADLARSVLALTGQPSPKPADASSARTRKSLGLRVARGWWYWPPRWEAVGLTKPVLLSVSWPKPKPGQCLGCWLVVHVRRGNIGGHQCWPVRLLERLLCPFWTSARRWVQMETLLPLLTLLLRAATYRSAPRCKPSLVVQSVGCEDFALSPRVKKNFIYRHHVEPRVKLYSPREESFPIPLKYIDVSRTTHTNLDVKQERHIDDYWNIDGSRDLSEYCDKFHSGYSIRRETSRRIYVVWGETDKKTDYIKPDYLWPEFGRNWEKCQAEREAKVVT